jgi:hypothetical protein
MQLDIQVLAWDNINMNSTIALLVKKAKDHNHVFLDNKNHNCYLYQI